MKICMLGAGAMGGSIGGVLKESGADVYLLDNWEEHVDTIMKHGLKIREDNSERIVKVSATTDCRDIGPVDLIVIMVKCFHTKEAIENARPIIGDKTTVLSLQNGLGSEDVISDILGKDRVLRGSTFVGGVLIGPGEVMIGRKGKLTFMGELDGNISERVNRIGKLFDQAGLKTIISDNIYGILWKKLLVNVAVGPLSAITRLPHGGMSEVNEVMECATEAVTEALAVAKANGVELSVNDPKEIWHVATDGLAYGHKASVLQDIEKGSKTEIDYINGIIVKLGAKYKVPTPVNKTLVAGVKGIEHGLKTA